MIKKVAAAAFSVAALSGMLFSATPATASTGAGGVAFAGLAHLPTFPCDPGPCGGGAFAGFAVGAGVAVGDSGPQAAVFAPNGATPNMASGFSYNEPCTGGLPAQGNAGGGIDVGGLTVPAGSTASGSFTWQRIGLLALITNNIDINTPGNHANLDGVAVAAFAPLAPVLCSSPGTVDAAVVGIDALIPS